MSKSTLVHLVYIHGFQGNDTSFQSFPTDLHQHLSAILKDSKPHITLRSSLYPTYKSIKPIANATKNFLEWLSTQPPGPVILVGHSMGGLLAAEAATDASNSEPGSRKPNRIVGVVAFDVPFLGMHPHVVVSGIASLFEKEDDKKSNATERQMNPNDVHHVDQRVTDDWDQMKHRMHELKSTESLVPPPLPPRNSSSASSITLSPTGPPPGYTPPLPHRPSSPLSPPPLPPRKSQATSSRPAYNPTHSSSSSMPFLERAMDFVSKKAEDPLVKWIRKHSDEPFSAGKRWVVEHLQFGGCMFDPSGLKDRYVRLVEWGGQEGGLWINYWTETMPRLPSNKEDEVSTTNTPSTAPTSTSDTMSINSADSFVTANEDEEAPPDAMEASNDLSVLDTMGADATKDTTAIISEADNAAGETEKQRKKAEEKERKKAEKELKKAEKLKEKQNKPIPGRHFIVRPARIPLLGGNERWEKVVIAGADNEVEAHCGLFIRTQNLDYDGLVEKVGKRVMGWM